MATEEMTTRRLSNSIKLLALSPAFLLFASAIRLLIIANYDPSVAVAIASSGGVTGTLLGTLIPIIPPFFPIMCLALLILRRWTLCTVSLFATFLVVPVYAGLVDSLHAGWHGLTEFTSLLGDRKAKVDIWPEKAQVVIFTSLVVLLVVVDWIPSLFKLMTTTPESSEYDSDEQAPAAVTRVLAATTVAALFMAVPAAISIFFFSFVNHMYHIRYDTAAISEVMRRPWLPMEKIRLKKGGMRLGYTVAVKDDFYVTLDDTDRSISYLRKDEVQTRQICRTSTDLADSPPPLINLAGATGKKVVEPCIQPIPHV
ncbi:hypothetical protein [Microbispora sp. H10949]|uniref:hypothetical protein n=1 Tax=Microbispora sp. H10949 TaxID=2729111 RepID=UPI001603F833|nr:hypothetical protein [Microbispora sp. H10949]